MQTKSSMSWISPAENPGRERDSVLSWRSSNTVLARHCSSTGMSKYLNLLFTMLGVKEMMSGTLHWVHRESKVLPRTVLLSLSKSLARSLTDSFLLEMRDLWKVTYLDANMTFGCMELEMVSTKYLCVHLST